MIDFLVTVRKGKQRITYKASADHGGDLMSAAYDLHGVCSVSVKALA